MPKHPYAAILQAVMDGQPVQLQTPRGEWVDIGPESALKGASNNWPEPHRYRVKPCTIKIGNFEVPPGLKHMPAPGSYVYWPVFGTPCACTTTQVGSYGSPFLELLLERGMLHGTQEAAELHSQALISFTCRANPDVSPP